MEGDATYWGADDNAAAVGVLMQVASALASKRQGRGVIIAAFDGEEPPFAGTAGMGSREFVRKPPVPLSTIDFMICMDLVGHRVGAAHLPDSIGQSLFALGAEKSTGTRSLVEGLARAQDGLLVRPVDAEVIRPLSDYEAFWREQVPFLFLSAGRSAVYHTPLDTPDKLDFEKIDATARWLTQFANAVRERDDAHRFQASARDDRGTLSQVIELFTAAAESSPRAEQALRHAQALRSRCDAQGLLPAELQPALVSLTSALEAGFA
jgi:Zn-dependent M28 family amino/carboxypeptidase